MPVKNKKIVFVGISTIQMLTLLEIEQLCLGSNSKKSICAHNFFLLLITTKLKAGSFTIKKFTFHTKHYQL